MGWDHCRVTHLYNDDILAHLNQAQHILQGPKIWEEVLVSFHFVCHSFILYDNPFVLYDNLFL